MDTHTFSILIQADKREIWNVLWEDTSFRDWANLIDEGTYMKGKLEENGEVEFISAVNGYGVTSLVEELRPHEYVRFHHQADTQDSGSDVRADEWTGGTESYLLEESKEGVTLSMTLTIPAHQLPLFSDRVPKALTRIKELAEA
ncbi:hypothetical protein ACFO4L_01135 [Bacillus daqingensis]|uniref:Polyketide cyclase / dehydrase and lipid transport n=1 Tax=Bacillus daqingensis TaxID=872396 RepID=A0ABV9NR72_9BACI